jgi:hypothetical protein
VGPGNRKGKNLRIEAGRTRKLGRLLIAVGGVVAMGCWLVIAVPRASAAGPPVIELESAIAGYVQIQVLGTVEANGEESRIYAEYATTEGGPFTFEQIGELPAGASGSSPVSGTIKGLEPETEYFVRLDAETGGFGETYSAQPYTAVTTKTVAKPIVSIDPPSVLGTRVIHLSGQINPNAPEPEGSTSPDEQAAFKTTWHFQCAVAGGSPSENACPGLNGSVAADDASHVVTAEAEGLPPNKNLEVELIATNAGGPASAGPLTFLTHDFARALSVSETAAVLYDEINPEGSRTTFHVDYGLTEAYGNSTSESPPIEAGGAVAEDNSPHPVQATLAGLQPGTTYHWRVVAANAAGTSIGSDHTFTTFATPASLGAGCANQAFRTGVGAILPDCRAYEQASPAAKNGGSVFGGLGMVQASTSGNRVTFRAPSGLSTVGGTTSFPLYVASRGADGWSTVGTLPLGEPGQYFQLLGWDAELATAISAGGASGSAQTPPGLYSADIAGGTYSRTAELHSAQPESTYLPGVAANPSHYIIESLEKLAPGGIEGKPNLYEANEGRLSSVGLIPPASATICTGESCVPATSGSFAGPYRWTRSDTAHGGGANYGSLENFYTENTISRDGSKIFFTAAESGQLYLREDGTRTIQVSASQKTTPDPNGTRPAAFVTATPDGSKVFFLSCEKLTDESTAESLSSTETCGGAEEGQDLYSFETSTGELTDLTEKANDPSATATHGAAVKGLVGISEDGSFVYFVANGVLTGSQENGNGERAEPGTCSSNPEEEHKSCNLYLAHGKTVVFVARLSQGPSADGADWVPYVNVVLKDSRVAADGALVFAAKESLTGYDNSLVTGGGANCRKPGAPEPTCEKELFRYQPGDGQLICVSCSATNAAPTGPAALESAQTGFPVPVHMIAQTRNLTGDGDRIFFDSPDSLVPADTNGVIDPYEWEAVGTGSCQAATANGGCLYILSSGKSPHPSFLADVSANGNDAFFFTTQPLVPADGDENLDVYDARVGGGLQSQYPPGAPEPCVGEACLGPADNLSAGATAGTSSFVGPGNPPAKKSCPKGKVRKHGKCTKKPKTRPKDIKKKHRAGGAGKRSGPGNGNRGGSK